MRQRRRHKKRSRIREKKGMPEFLKKTYQETRSVKKSRQMTTR